MENPEMLFPSILDYDDYGRKLEQIKHLVLEEI